MTGDHNRIRVDVEISGTGIRRYEDLIIYKDYNDLWVLESTSYGSDVLGGLIMSGSQLTYQNDDAVSLTCTFHTRG